MIPATTRTRLRHGWQRLDRAGHGLAADLLLYTLSAAFAGITAVTSTLLPHRAWGSVASVGYLVAALATVGLLLLRRYRIRPGQIGRPGEPTGRPGEPTPGEHAGRPDGPAADADHDRAAVTGTRATLVALTWCTSALLPLLWQAVERAGGRLDRAQEEVLVTEEAGARLLDTGTPYLSRAAIAALPPEEQLLGYTPYQPGMAVFGLPRALAGVTWWSDARVWFAVATAATLTMAVMVTLRQRPDRSRALVRALQLSAVLPISALTLATGGDDLPVLALCLLALACCAARMPGTAGLVIGCAAALKLFAWPVLAVLVIHALTRGRRWGWRLTVPALGVPVAVLVPVQLADPGALVENVLRFPLGHGLVESPAQSPLPGHLIATALPAGRAVAAVLLVLTGLLIAVQLIRRPPRTAARAAAVCGYGLLAAILLMPTTRFGYLLYPIALLAWAAALATSTERPTTQRTAGATR